MPHLAAHGVESKGVEPFGRPIRVEAFDSFDDPNMKRAAAFLELAAVRHFVRQRPLERVFELSEEACFVQEFRGLQPDERLTNPLLRFLSDRL